MILVGLAVVLGDVRQWPKTPRVGSRLDRYPECQGAKVIQGCALSPSLKGTGLRLSMAPSFNGVTDIMVIADLVVRRGMPRRKVTPSLMLRLGTPGL